MMNERVHMIGRILIDQSNNMLIQFFRYAIVGVIAFMIDFAALFFLTDIFHFHYLVSAAMAFLLGLATNYIFSIFWVFPNRRLQRKTFEFSIFASIGIIGLCFNELTIWLFTEYGQLHYLASKIFSAGIIFLWNFFARKLLLFR